MFVVEIWLETCNFPRPTGLSFQVLMKRFLNIAVVAGLAWVAVSAAIPLPQDLLPNDTIGFATVPDVAKIRTASGRIPIAQLWNDESMRPFREKFIEKFKTTVIADLEKDLGVKLSDYTSLPQGQLTAAVVANGFYEPGGDPTNLAWVVILDAKDKADDLQKRLSELKKKWSDQGKQLRAEKIRDAEFTVLAAPKNPIPASGSDDDDDDAKGAPAKKPVKKAAPAKKEDLYIGQVQSVLILGNQPKVLERIVSRLGGGSSPVISEVPAFDQDYRKQMRESLAYGWVNITPLVDYGVKQMAKAPKPKQPNPFAPQPEKILEGLGLKAIKTVLVALDQSPDGTVGKLYIGAPKEERKGLLKIFALEAKDSAPPAFVPADVSRYARIRIDGAAGFKTLEQSLMEISPQLGGILQMSLGAAGKEKDPNFDLRKALFGNLGNDFITYDKPPRSMTPGDLASAPSITLIGSANPEQLLIGIKAFLSLLPPPIGGSVIKEREVGGKKVYGVLLPPVPGPDGKMKDRTMEFASAGGYVAICADPALLEDFVRNPEKTEKPLRELPSLADTAQKVGGLGTGMFMYSNSYELVKNFLEAIRKDPKLADQLNPPAGTSSMPGMPNFGQWRDWADFSLLPPFEKISKYLTYSVGSGVDSADGMTFMSMQPIPATLK